MKENFAIIFDLDGTLANTIPSICKALADAFKNFNIQPPTKEEFMSMFGTTEYGILKIHCPEKSEELFAEYLRLYALYTSEESPKAFDGIIPILQKLKNANVPMALVTGKSLASAYYSIGKYNLDGFFDYVEIGGDTGSVKTIRIKAILERWKKPLGNIYYLGDSPHDVDEAKAAGLKSLSAAWAGGVFSENIEAKKPEKVFYKVSEFDAWINQKLQS